ncbi:hypothetical protein DOTSEDRAFT_27843 [Dothistroma septosporum NZE10]|uniref:Uncharacterized protein n=1 Tax=Dothistroma septosporum (strain NZE10 / CBS 128990) TaxID=675120 RepID=N1PF18_DOTSN|nr:hypothetical protein DOTSEDRAFT_27843 [Dothistroma septosporum NZE10]
MTTDEAESEGHITPSDDSVYQIHEANKRKLLVCTNEYSQMLHRAPELTLFVKNYMHQYQAELLSVNPAVKGATVHLRKLLADLVHETLDAALADVLVAVKAQEPKMIANDRYVERVNDDVTTFEEAVSQQNELAVKVQYELGFLVGVAKEAVDDELLSLHVH